MRNIIVWVGGVPPSQAEPPRILLRRRLLHSPSSPDDCVLHGPRRGLYLPNKAGVIWEIGSEGDYNTPRPRARPNKPLFSANELAQLSPLGDPEREQESSVWLRPSSPRGAGESRRAIFRALHAESARAATGAQGGEEKAGGPGAGRGRGRAAPARVRPGAAAAHLPGGAGRGAALGRPRLPPPASRPGRKRRGAV